LDGYLTFLGNIWKEEEELSVGDSYLESVQVEGSRQSE